LKIIEIKRWDEIVANSPIIQAGIEVMEFISGLQENAEAFMVGGMVRDLILSPDNKPDDIDIATNVSIDLIEPHFKCHDIGKNKDFGILVVEHNGFHFEVANFRRDGNYSDGRRPDEVEMVDSFKEDAARRDFTINAMGVDKDGTITDFFNGCADLAVGCIDTVGDPENRFAEDYLRMLRAVRFAARFQFGLEKKTLYAIQWNAKKILNVSWERILKELNKMAELSGDKFANAIELLDLTGLLKYILPEISAMKGLNQNPKFHPEGDVYDHTLAALRYNGFGDRLVNWSILLHDIGKTVTHSVDETGDHYYKHHLKSASLIRVVAERLKMDNETRDCAIFAAENHMTMHDFMKVKPSVAMKLIDHKYWVVLYKVGMCDSASRGDLYDSNEYVNIASRAVELKERFKQKQAIDAIGKVVNGVFIMKVRPDIKPSPEMGKIKNATIEWIIDEGIDLEDIKKITEFVRGYNDK